MRYAFLSMGILGALMAVADQPFATNKVISVTVGDGYILEELETGEPCVENSFHITIDQDGVATLADPNETSFPTLPGPESATNEVAVALLELLRISDVDNFEHVDENGVPYTSQPITPTWTWDGFLGKDETNGWTRAAKKACFDWYLNFVATNRSEYSDFPSNIVCVAITQCEDLKYTNAWESLEHMARNPDSPHRMWSGKLAIEYAPVGAPLFDLGLDAATNGLRVTADERYAIVGSFADRLCSVREESSLSSVVILYRMRLAEYKLSLALDRLFVSRILGYVGSSNRLDTANKLLSLTELNELQREHFGTVTNQLLNAAQPLPEVEALRGL